jgi:hypothetical protein
MLYMAGIMAMLMASCKKDHEPAVHPIAITVQAAYSPDQAALGLSLKSIPVTISNNTNGQSYNAATDESGLASFASVVPGNYIVQATITFTAEQYQSVTGVPAAASVTFNASVNANIQSDQAIQLVLTPGRIGDLVFKQLYYAGSNTSTGASFRDEFAEIYNNSNDTIYLDSLYFGNTWSNNKTVASGAVTFDWSQSIGMPAGIGDPSKDYIYARYLFMIPGSGNDHPLPPGQSIVIAQTALNHTQPYTDNAGNPQGITNPALTVDLSQADFETYLVDYKREKSANPATFTPYRWDLDNPSVPNVAVISVVSGNDWVFDAPGREDFFMFKTGENVSAWPSYPDPTVTAVTSTTNVYKQIPVKYVLDAVEIITPVAANRIPKRLPVSLDGAGTFVTGGQYSSQSLIRKTAKTLDGRVILQDTNNSANDFDTKQKADPSKSAASFTTN